MIQAIRNMYLINACTNGDPKAQLLISLHGSKNWLKNGQLRPGAGIMQHTPAWLQTGSL